MLQFWFLQAGPVFLVLCPLFAAVIQGAPRIPDTDRIRLAEAFRIADQLGDRVWSGWSKAPFAVALITPEYEFLIRHPNPPADFTRGGVDPLLGSEVYFRKRVFQIELLASFPFNGVPTIVIGQAENTDAKSSTPWVVTLLHEHFHQLQYSQPGYYSQVAGLGLARGDETGRWMLAFQKCRQERTLISGACDTEATRIGSIRTPITALSLPSGV